MESHKYANLFPMMTPAELKELCADMQAHGYDKTSAIVLFNGEILDGRNRQLAADTVGVMPVYSEFEGSDADALDFVIRHNLHRRHLDETQRGRVASKLANMTRGGDRPSAVDGNFDIANLHNRNEVSQSAAAEMLNVSPRMVATIKAVEKAAPDLVEKMDAGEMTANAAMKEVKARQRTAARAEIATAGASVPMSEKWHIYQGDIAIWKAPRQYDYIITDPPYPKEYLPLWGVLAERAAEWLKPGGLLIAMSGQSYLDEVYAMLSKHLEYYWTAAYLTPGSPTPLRNINVNTNWKPLLIMMLKGEKYSGKIFMDVFKSDANDKDFHKWGQSESGMFDIISKICLPGQYILDPFCGAGTTGIAALKHGCLFEGLDLDENNVNISKGRLS